MPATISIYHYLDTTAYRFSKRPDHLQVLLICPGTDFQLQTMKAGFHQHPAFGCHLFVCSRGHHEAQRYLLVGETAQQFIDGNSQCLAHDVVQGVINDCLCLCVTLGSTIHPGHDFLYVKGVLTKEDIGPEDTVNIVHNRILALTHVPWGCATGLGYAHNTLISVHLYQDDIRTRLSTSGHYHWFGKV